MKAGYIPNNIVKITNVKRIQNSRLFKSGMLNIKYLENEPANAILLNINIVYPAESTIDELAIRPNKGNLSNTPYKDINSPIKFKVRGTPQLPKHNIKNKIENKGII